MEDSNVDSMQIQKQSDKEHINNNGKAVEHMNKSLNKRSDN